MNYVNIENLSFSYDDKKIFSNVNMQIRKGDFISILSSNSSGKTTFLRLIKGLLNYNGTITVDNKEISTIKENICLLTPFTESYSKTILDELLLITNDIVKIKKILKDFDLYDVRMLLQNSPGIILVDNIEKEQYPIASKANGNNEVFVGRIRRDFSVPYGLNMWVVADNLRKGAATNAVQILEILLTN